MNTDTMSATTEPVATNTQAVASVTNTQAVATPVTNPETLFEPDFVRVPPQTPTRPAPSVIGEWRKLETPPPPPSPQLPPPTPRKQVPPIEIPTPLIEHRGKGITVEFAPQTPSQTRADYRRYLLNTLCDWIRGPLQAQAREIDIFSGMEVLRAAEYLIEGSWPAMRLWYIAETLESPIVDPIERYDSAAGMVADWLQTRDREWPVAEGFLKVDRVVDGRTVWDLMEMAASPFEALRSAGELSDSVSEEGEEAGEGESESESESESEGEEANNVCSLDMKFTVTLSLFDIIVAIVAIVTYLWFVAGVLSIMSHRVS